MHAEPHVKEVTKQKTKNKKTKTPLAWNMGKSKEQILTGKY